MICCDSCSAWQHNDCMLLPYAPEDAPDKYYCERCKPEDHQDLLAAISRGEKPWKEIARKREAAEVGKAAKKKKGGRRRGKAGSRPNEAMSEASLEPDPTQTPDQDIGTGVGGQKRKLVEPSHEAGSHQVSSLFLLLWLGLIGPNPLSGLQETTSEPPADNHGYCFVPEWSSFSHPERQAERHSNVIGPEFKARGFYRSDCIKRERASCPEKIRCFIACQTVHVGGFCRSEAGKGYHSLWSNCGGDRD